MPNRRKTLIFLSSQLQKNGWSKIYNNNTKTNKIYLEDKYNQKQT